MPYSSLKKNFFNDTATTEIYTRMESSAASDVYKRQVHIVSARRTSNRLLKYAKSVEENRVKVIIASASGAVYLPGILASKTHIPVIGVPINTKKSKAPNSSLSLMHMPIGLPVGTLAMGPAGAVNAALLATNILANDHDVIRKALVNYRAQQITPSPHMMNPSVAV